MTVEEFLRWEGEQPDRHEFSDGVVTALAGGTKAHAVLSTALAAMVYGRLRGTRCRALTSDAIVLTGTGGRYPDLTVTCDDRDLGDLDGVGIAHPTLIFEVLSVSTAAVDRGAKLDEYRALASLEEYVLVDSRRRWVMTYRRVDDAWLASLPATSGAVRLWSIDFELDVDALYADVGL